MEGLEGLGEGQGKLSSVTGLKKIDSHTADLSSELKNSWDRLMEKNLVALIQDLKNTVAAEQADDAEEADEKSEAKAKKSKKAKKKKKDTGDGKSVKKDKKGKK